MSVALHLSSAKTTTRMQLKRAPIPAEPPLTDEQKHLIRDSFAKIEPAIDLVAQVFFRKLFALDSSLRAKFSGPIEITTTSPSPWASFKRSASSTAYVSKSEIASSTERSMRFVDGSMRRPAAASGTAFTQTAIFMRARL
jgi:hypothetical protein